VITVFTGYHHEPTRDFLFHRPCPTGQLVPICPGTGLIEAIEDLPRSQKTVIHSPQSKVLQFLVGILGGLEYPKDFSLSAHPLDQDPAVARAWGQDLWADYSGVSHTLSQLSEA
jgi:hypothetical protein